MKDTFFDIDFFIVIAYFILANPAFAGFDYTPWIIIVGIVLAVCNIILAAIAFRTTNTKYAWKILFLLAGICVYVGSNYYFTH